MAKEKSRLGTEPVYDARTLGKPRMLILGLQHMFAGAGKDPASPACVGAWGPALELPALRSRLEAQLADFTRDTLGHHLILCTGQQMPAVGAAAAALYNP